MNTSTPQGCFTPFIPEGLPLQYDGPLPTPPRQMGSSQQDTHSSGPTPRSEGHPPPPPPPPPPPYPPMLVPVFPFGVGGYPGIFNPNYTIYSPPHEDPVPSRIHTYASSHQSNPPFLPPQSAPRSGYHSASSRSGSGTSTSSSRTSSDRTHSHQSRRWGPPPGPPPPPPPPPPPLASMPAFVPSHISAGIPMMQPSLPTRITGRYGIHELLNCQLDSLPFIDWVVFSDLSLARQWVIRKSGTERCQSVDFDGLAVVPPVNNLCIRTRGQQLQQQRINTPVEQAIQRWGDIKVCRFDRFLSVGDVLHEIWAYFYTPLTEDEKATMHSPFSRRVEVCFQKRLNAQGKLPELAVMRRCDTLLGCVRFAGLEIALDFETCRELYLSLADAGFK